MSDNPKKIFQLMKDYEDDGQWMWVAFAPGCKLIYTEAGKYNVTLHVENEDGNSMIEKTGEDNEFLYFSAETPGFSYYSIIGEKKASVTISPAATGSETDEKQITGDEVSDTDSEKAKKSPGSGPIFAVTCVLSALYLLKNRS